MNLSFKDFVKRFNEPIVEEAELTLKGSQEYFILQKHGKVIDLYKGEMAEYLEDPSYKREAENIVQLFQNNETGKVAFIHEHRNPQGVKLIKHMKDINTLLDYIDFDIVVEVTYEKKK
jgi:hypothetical protein